MTTKSISFHCAQEHHETAQKHKEASELATSAKESNRHAFCAQYHAARAITIMVLFTAMRKK